MSSHYFRMRLLSLSALDICEQSYRQHQEILQLVLAKDYASIREMINRHIVDKKMRKSAWSASSPICLPGSRAPIT